MASGVSESRRVGRLKRERATQWEAADMQVAPSFSLIVGQLTDDKNYVVAFSRRSTSSLPLLGTPPAFEALDLSAVVGTSNIRLNVYHPSQHSRVIPTNHQADRYCGACIAPISHISCRPYLLFICKCRTYHHTPMRREYTGCLGFIEIF